MEEHTDFSRQPTVALLQVVVVQSSASALAELLEHRALFFDGKKRVILPEFIWTLSRNSLRSIDGKPVIDEIAESAYDLTLRKFSELPDAGDEKANEKTAGKVKRKQIDCRNYFRVVLTKMEEWRKQNPEASELEEEREVAAILQKLVVKHFYLSKLEAQRNARPFATRYQWRHAGKVITLWYPVELGIGAFKRWLEGRATSAAEGVQELQSRLQAEIDAHFFRGRFASLDDNAVKESLAANPNSEAEPGNRCTTPSKLALAVAAEKANNIDSMRPAIRELGPRMLTHMILRIFEDLADGVFEDRRIAADFGLSKATFSRFAGSKWKNREAESGAAIPDLWKNTARVVAADPAFLSTAMEAGVSKSIKKVLGGQQKGVKNGR